MNQFQLDIITPTSINSYDKITYLRLPALDGLLGVQAKHAKAIIALDIGEIKMVIDGKTKYFATNHVNRHTVICINVASVLVKGIAEVIRTLTK